jgi:MarR family transcriptional regulator, organic hydroperoxide resistance regulator
LRSEFGLPLTHFEPMSVMDRLPRCRVYDITTELGITTGGTSKVVDRIEASGYCRRLPNTAARLAPPEPGAFRETIFAELTFHRI